MALVCGAIKWWYSFYWFQCRALVRDPVEPEDTDWVCPKFFLNRLNDTVDLWAIDALDVRTVLLRVGQQVPAARTEPVILRDRFEKLAAIAFLVHCGQAKLTDDNLIPIIIVIIQADIAHYIVIIGILFNSDGSIQVLLHFQIVIVHTQFELLLLELNFLALGCHLLLGLL